MFDCFRRRGFEHPEILHFIFGKAKEEQEQNIWHQFAKDLYALKPSELHRALVLMADRRIATTNYDVLLELAAHDVRRYDPMYVMEPIGGSGRNPPDPYPPRGEELVILKLHGSLPPPKGDGSHTSEMVDQWIESASYRQLVTTSVVYRTTALGPSVEDRLLPFFEFRAALERDDHVFVFLGTSLTPAELILMRFLYSRWGARKNLIILDVRANAEPTIRFQELGIDTLWLPQGLAAAPERMRLAYIVLLELLLDRIDIKTDRKKRASDSLKLAYRELPFNDLVKSPLSNISPVVCCVGPLQTSRVIGIAQPAQQETFHGPPEATRAPDSKEKELLISDSSLGQGGNPLLVWDAMGLPSAVVAEIGDDAAGDGILGSLSERQWIDFDGVLEVIPQSGGSMPTEASPGVATESFTCVTWFGFRTGFDSRRFGEKGSRLPREDWGAKFKEIQNVPILYVTKVLSHELMAYFDKQSPSSTKPLMVLETGGGGEPDIEKWVAQHYGIVIASAKTALRWFNTTSPDAGDEFGRYVQMTRLLKALLEEINKEKDKENPEFVSKNSLTGARALVVTLGELGALSWEQKNSKWLGPFWTFPTSFEQHANEPEPFEKGTSLPLHEVRDALGCGDCARAGFVASLARSLDFKPLQGDLPQHSVSLALASLNWFGIQKIRHFGMDRYLDSLRKNVLRKDADNFWKLWEAAAAGLDRSTDLRRQIQLGPGNFEQFETRDAAKEIDNEGLLGKWMKRFDPEKTETRDENRGRIKQLAQRWAEERGLVETRPPS
ncbi:MAG: hypothetical protein LAO08_00315 [Acidobacteriia bacterium]|nr:hypothetical protein [Terriglobia bacterium]